MPRTSLSLFTLLPVLLNFLDAFSVLNLLDGAIRQVAKHQERNCHDTLRGRSMIHHITFLDAFSVLNLLDGAIRQVARHQEGNCHGTFRLMIHHNTSGTLDSLHHDNSQFFDKFFLCKANNFPFGFRLNFSPIEEKLAFPCSTFLVPMQLCNPFYKELVLL